MSHLRNLLQYTSRELEAITQSTLASEWAELTSPDFDHDMPWEDNDRELISQTISLLQKQKRLIRRAQRRKTAREMRRKNEFQPIFRLPRELLISIVELGAPVIGDAWSEVATPSNPGRMSGWRQWTIKEYEDFRQSLGLTCTAFFSLIMQSPSCWTCIPLALTQSFLSINSPVMGSSSLTALENSLKRSSPVPFDLFIINELSDALSAWNNFRNLLIPHLHRCRGILLASAYPAYGLFEQLFNGTKLGALKHLLLSWGRWGEPGWSTSPNPLPISFSHPALPLESLSLCDGHHVMPHDFLQSLLNSSTSSTLRRLRLVGAIPPKTVLPFLPHFQSLEHLTWQLKSPHTDKYYSATPINFPYLVTLTVSGFEGFRSFPPIIAPRLVQLTFAGNDHDDSKYLRTANSHLFSYKDYPPVSIFHPNQRFLPALRQLRFNPRFHQLDRVIRFLASHPLLNDVTIDNDPVVSMSEEDAKGLIIIINTLARSLPPATSTTTSPESPLTSLHVNFVGSRLDWGYGETLLAALIRLHKRASKVAIHYIGQDGLDVEAPMLPHFLEPCGDHEFHCVWREPWSECERLGNNLHQDDDDVWD